MSFEDYNPPSSLVVPENILTQAKFPFVDVHNHQFDMPLKDLTNLTAEMDSLNMAFMVNLSGFRGLYLAKCIENVKENAPTRFGLFVNLDWEKIDEDDFVKSMIQNSYWREAGDVVVKELMYFDSVSFATFQ